mgnify:FL=1
MSMRYVRLNLHLARLYALGVVLLSADIRACNNLTTPHMYGTGMKRNATMFQYREECLNSSRPKEFSLVGINSAIQKPKEAT